MIGRKTQLSPSGAFNHLGKSHFWKNIGTTTILTGFLVSSFYAVIAGWTLGYFIQALLGKLTQFQNSKDVLEHFTSFSSSPLWSIGSLFGIIFLSTLILCTGVRRGIERGNKIMMPLLFIVLIFLVIKGVMMPGGEKGISFIFYPNWSDITPTSILIALGQAFFSLSLGQGTMVTYGSYIEKNENLPSTCLPITFFGICISLLAGVAIFTIVFSCGMQPSAGESLMFQTLPIIFSRLTGGYFLCLLFFILLLLAALTSQISAMEPLIAYLIDKKKWKRYQAVLSTGISVFIMAIPCALSFGLLRQVTLFGKNFFDFLLFLCLNILIPIGGLAAVILVGWKWGMNNGIRHLKEGASTLFKNYPVIETYFRISIKYLAPFIIILIMIDALGLF